MTIQFTCPECGGACRADERLGGLNSQCAKCQAPLVVPGTVPEFVDFSCPECGNACHVPRSLAGEKARCVRCDAPIVVPTSNGQPSAAEVPRLRPARPNRAPHKTLTDNPSQRDEASASVRPPLPPMGASRERRHPPSVPDQSSEPGFPAAIPPPLPISATLRKKHSSPALWFGLVMLIVGGVTAAGIFLDRRLEKYTAEGFFAEADQALKNDRFDANSFDATADWAEELSSVVRRHQVARRGNELAMEQMEEERQVVNKRLALLNGTKVRWKLPVERVTKEYVVLKYGLTPMSRLMPEPGVLVAAPDRRIVLSFGKRARFGVLQSSTAVLEIGNDIDARVAQSLRPGEPITVTARVDHVLLGNKGPHHIYVELTDVSTR